MIRLACRNRSNTFCTLTIAFVLLAMSPEIKAGEVGLFLLGTTEPPATREIVVGPDVFGCALCETVSVVDVDLTEGLTDVVSLPAEGGDVHVFLYTDVAQPSAGLMSMVLDLRSSSPDLEISPVRFDVVFRDVPGRMGTYFGMPSSIPEERSISGDATTDDSGYFRQAWSSPYEAVSGLESAKIRRDISAGMYLLTIAEIGHTFGIGQTGNDQSGGPTAVARFTVSVPPLPAGAYGGTYAVTVQTRRLLTYVENPVFTDPLAQGADIVEIADVSFVERLIIAVGGAPAGSGDCDFDGDIMLTDFGMFQLCFTGSGAISPPGCECVDFDGDGDVDLVDFGTFQNRFTSAVPEGAIALPDPADAVDMGDSDSDGDIDAVDWSWFQYCFTGPGNDITIDGCDIMDYDDDNDVDLVDFGSFKLGYTGPVLP